LTDPFTWKNRRVLVTGAGGFIGSHLAERIAPLIKTEILYIMEVLDRLDEYFPDADLRSTDSEWMNSEFRRRVKAICA